MLKKCLLKPTNLFQVNKVLCVLNLKICPKLPLNLISWDLLNRIVNLWFLYGLSALCTFMYITLFYFVLTFFLHLRTCFSFSQHNFLCPTQGPRDYSGGTGVVNPAVESMPKQDWGQQLIIPLTYNHCFRDGQWPSDAWETKDSWLDWWNRKRPAGPALAALPREGQREASTKETARQDDVEKEPRFRGIPIVKACNLHEQVNFLLKISQLKIHFLWLANQDS